MCACVFGLKPLSPRKNTHASTEPRLRAKLLKVQGLRIRALPSKGAGTRAVPSSLGMKDGGGSAGDGAHTRARQGPSAQRIQGWQGRGGARSRAPAQRPGPKSAPNSSRPAAPLVSPGLTCESKRSRKRRLQLSSVPRFRQNNFGNSAKSKTYDQVYFSNTLVKLKPVEPLSKAYVIAKASGLLMAPRGRGRHLFWWPAPRRPAPRATTTLRGSRMVRSVSAAAFQRRIPAHRPREVGSRACSDPPLERASIEVWRPLPHSARHPPVSPQPLQDGSGVSLMALQA